MEQRLLIVDDEEAVLFAMVHYFTQLGYGVDSTNEFEQARKLVMENVYSAVIADLRLSDAHGFDGLALLEAARQRSEKTKAILLTAWSTPAIEQAAKRIGVQWLLQKPLPLLTLARLLAEPEGDS